MSLDVKRTIGHLLTNFRKISLFSVALNVDPKSALKINQRTNGPVNAHLISWPSKATNIQTLENIW